MRFCSLNTYLSTLRQSIVFHPTIFVCKFVLGLFTSTYTFSFNTFASHVCLSWELPHPFSGITRHFGLGICFLTHPSQSHHMVWCLPVLLGMWLGYFVPTYHWFVFFRIHLSTYVSGLCVTRKLQSSKTYAPSDFPDAGCGVSTSLLPLLVIWDGSVDDS